MLRFYIEDDESSTLRKTKPQFYLTCSKIPKTKLEGFDLYPNPTNDRFIIAMHSSITSDGNIAMSDQLGKQVKVIKLNSNSIAQEVNTSEIESGIYYVSVQCGEKKLDTKKVVIIR